MSVLFINAAPIGVLEPLFAMTQAPQVDAVGLTSVVSEIGRNLEQAQALGMVDRERAAVQGVLHTLTEHISTYTSNGVVPTQVLQPTLHSLLRAWPARLNRRETPPDDISKEYCVWNSIGSGGCSRVCLAYSRETGTIAVVKVADASDNPSLSQETAERVLRDEYEILSSLEEGTGPRVYRLGTLNGQLCLVMEYLETNDLDDTLQSLQHSLTTLADFERALDIARQAVRAIASVHSQGVVHADIKPENFKYQDGSMRVFDFGIASRAGTPAAFITGTPGYMPPESFYEDATSDPRRDVFALGALIYQLLTGRTPFDAENAQEIVRRTVDPSFRIEPPSTILLRNHPALQGQIPIALLNFVDTVVLKALNRDPNQRHPDAEALFRSLRNAVVPGRPAVPAAPVPMAAPVSPQPHRGPQRPTRSDSPRAARRG